MKKTHTFALAAAGTALTLCAIRKATRGNFSFAGKVCLITGGSRGLGLVLARRICAEGGRVALLARDLEELRRAHDDLAMRGGEVVVVPCDLLQRDQIEEALRKVVEHFGPIDVLINNAGIIEVGPLEHMSREDFERAMQLHLWAPFTLMWEVIPQMRRRGGGRIINISSIGGKIAVPHLAAYCASKYALVGLSDAMRAELARDRIYLTTVAPGMMRTGSHVNAKFKGRHAAEFAWFAVSNSTPLISISAESAAKQILEASRIRRPEITLTMAARVAIIGNAIFPSITGHIMKLANRLLPTATDSSGNQARSGAESRSRKMTPRWSTSLADEASAQNNEAGVNGSR
ncbi:MAG: SDR family oxidoreductase [Verrucomicrobiota bacterium]|nr:SDR family oxidoreductase [Verrucomicrobiota bacterium]